VRGRDGRAPQSFRCYHGIPNRLGGCTSSPGRRYHPRRSFSTGMHAPLSRRTPPPARSRVVSYCTWSHSRRVRIARLCRVGGHTTARDLTCRVMPVQPARGAAWWLPGWRSSINVRSASACAQTGCCELCSRAMENACMHIATAHGVSLACVLAWGFIA
jgi:hypothetical protein